MNRLLLVLGMLVTTVAVSVVSNAQTAAGDEHSQFRFEFCAGGRGHFYVPVSSPAPTYRASAQSFDTVACESPVRAPELEVL